MHLGKDNPYLSCYMEGRKVESCNTEKDFGKIATSKLDTSLQCHNGSKEVQVPLDCTSEA